MSSNEESQFAVGGSATRKTWRTKLLLAVVSAVGVAVVVAACAAVVVASRGEKGGVVDTGVDSVVEWESPGMQLQGRVRYLLLREYVFTNVCGHTVCIFVLNYI